ncbi:MAG TPA: tetratricopeptide repeat protein [Anaerolineales bacterium]|nr:tetratricopeptide repeat protein [Anaerolineales bacterium]
MLQTQTFGYWLRRRRKVLDLTREDLARRVGCSAATIRKIEAEERRPSIQIAERLAEIFEIPSDDKNNFVRFARGSWDFAPVEIVDIYQEAPWRIRPANVQPYLPRSLTSFIGREKVVEKVTGILETNRLVTLTGAGGVGKTRLAIQITTQIKDYFRDGVYWVELASLTDETLVLQAIAISVGVHEIPNQTIKELLSSFLASRHLLLILDNCEHLIGECARLVDWLLRTCPNLKIMATSREALGLVSEVIYAVPVLSLPNVKRISLVDLLMQYEGIRLFVERASAIKPDFKLTEQNAFSVARICQRLDGIPLAIELAAARIMMMSVSEIDKRLDSRFDLLTVGNRAALPRHQTLRATIDWSHELLSVPEKIFFRRLAVFSGGFTLEAVERVTVGDAVSTSQVVALLGQLINKSLVVVNLYPEDPEAETRYGMLETIREYAREKLVASSEAEHFRQAHHNYFIKFVEQAGPKLKGAQQVKWLNRLEAEHDNLRAVLYWLKVNGDAETCLGLCVALFWFWYRNAYWSEGRAWLEQVLAANLSLMTSKKGEALYGAAYLTRALGDFALARKLVEQNIEIWRSLGAEGAHGLSVAKVFLGNLIRDEGDPGQARVLIEEGISFLREQGDEWNLALSLGYLGLAIRDQGRNALASSTLEESAKLWRKLEEPWGLAEVLHNLALVAYRQGDYIKALEVTEEALSIRRQLGDKHLIAYSIHNLGVFALAQSKIEQAKPYFEQDFLLFREVGDKSGMVLSLQYQGLFAHFEGDDGKARNLLNEGLRMVHEVGPKWISSNYLLWIAELYVKRGQLTRAVRLCCAAKTHLDAISSFWDAFESGYYERIIQLARASISEDAFNLAEAEGQALRWEEAISYALEEDQ